MNNGWIIGMQKDHTPSNLFSQVDPCLPWDNLVRLMHKIKQSRSVTVLVDDIEIIVMLADSNKGDKLRMMSDFH